MCPAILVSTSLLSSLVSAAILTTLSPTTLLPPLPPPPLSLPQNTTNTTTLSPNAIRFQCDGTRYGHISNPFSCHDLFHYIAESTTQSTFSDRHTGRPNDVPLPWRIQSSDGLCFLQPLLIRGATSGHASSMELGQAGYQVFQHCAVEKGVGGIATDVGGDNHVSVVIGSYEPRVRCDRTAVKGPPWESCLLITADMRTSMERKVFGDKKADPRVQDALPFTYQAIDARCQVTVDISGKSTSATWYEIWEAMVALSTMCVRAQGKGGKAFGLGLRKNIFIQISDENPEFSQNNPTIANVSAPAALSGLEAGNALIEVA